MIKRPTPARLQRLSGAALVLTLGLAGSYAAWAAGAPAAAQSQNPPRYLRSVVAADHITPPEYPAEALKQGVSGTVVLEVLVGKDGRVADVRLVKSTPKGTFEAAAIAAARGWTFVPGRDDAGKPLAGWVRVPVEFKI